MNEDHQTILLAAQAAQILDLTMRLKRIEITLAQNAAEIVDQLVPLVEKVDRIERLLTSLREG